MLPSKLIETLHHVAHLLSKTHEPWWILGSGAVALKGYDAGPVGDVDVLVSERDADHLIDQFGLKNRNDGGTLLYRSSYFLTPDLGPMPVEIMAGYEIHADQIWHPIWPTSRQRVQVSGVDLFVPSDAHLIEIFRMLGREKDQQRIHAMNNSK